MSHSSDRTFASWAGRFCRKMKKRLMIGVGDTLVLCTEENNRKTLKTRRSQWEKWKEGKPVFVEMGVESQERYCWVLLMIRGRKTRDYTTPGQVSSCARIWGGGLGRVWVWVRQSCTCHKILAPLPGDSGGGGSWGAAVTTSVPTHHSHYPAHTHAQDRKRFLHILVKTSQTKDKLWDSRDDFVRLWADNMLRMCLRVRMTVCELLECFWVSQKHTRVEKSLHSAKPSKQECLCCSLSLSLSILFCLPSVPHCFSSFILVKKFENNCFIIYDQHICDATHLANQLKQKVGFSSTTEIQSTACPSLYFTTGCTYDTAKQYK